MGQYMIGGKRVRRKNLFMPCAISRRTEDMTDEELVEVLKKTWWCDNITNTEWRTILPGEEPPSYKGVVRSRLKKKMIGWLMALGRLAVFEPELYNKAVDEAAALYRELIGSAHPVFPSVGE